MRALDVGCGPGRADARARGAARRRPRRRDRPRRAVRRRRAARATRAPTCAWAAPRSCRGATASSTPRCASLVVAFMRDAAAGTREMARVTRPGGVVAGVHVGHPGRRHDDAGARSGARRGRSTPTPRASRRASGCARARSPSCSRGAGLEDVQAGTLDDLGAHYEDFDDFWEPFTFAVGPAGSTCASRRRTGSRRSATSASRCSASRPARSTSRRAPGTRAAPSPS